MQTCQRIHQRSNRARWYDGTVGRWISEDPIGFAAGDANVNRYVGNDPTNFVDPSGLEGGPPGPPSSTSAPKPAPPPPLRAGWKPREFTDEEWAIIEPQWREQYAQNAAKPPESESAAFWGAFLKEESYRVGAGMVANAFTFGQIEALSKPTEYYVNQGGLYQSANIFANTSAVVGYSAVALQGLAYFEIAEFGTAPLSEVV